MPLKEALMTIIRHVVGAATALLAFAVMLEWLLPGSALPLVDAIDPLPFMSALTILLFLGVKRKSGWRNTIQIAIGLLTLVCLLAILFFSMPNYGLASLGLLLAGAAGSGVWAEAYSSKSE